jgi:probable blue pigment (indigoidine) exporter
LKPVSNKNIQFILAGIFFAILWPSAAVTTKIGLQYSQPFVIAVTRFFLASVIMLFFAHAVLQKKLPQQNQWKQLAIYGFLNITTYLGLYVLAMQQVSAGLGSLSIATNPVFISIISAIWFKHKVTPVVIVSLLLCLIGVVIAAYPLLLSSYATPAGLALLVISMLCYSAGAIYFSKSHWNNLHILTINGWQTLFGGIFLLPFALYFYDGTKNNFTTQWALSILWLAIPVSIAAVQLWLFLLSDNPVKASFWLFLCPVFGFALAALVMQEPLSLYTLTGVLFVIAGLYLVFKKKRV